MRFGWSTTTALTWHGAAFFVRPDDQIVTWMQSRGIPIVTADIGPAPGIDVVDPDHADGVKQAVEHLVSLGHRRIGYVNTHETGQYAHRFSVDVRHNSYVDVMTRMKLCAPPGSERPASFEEQVQRLLRGGGVTAMLCYDDHIAMTVIRLLGDQLVVRGSTGKVSVQTSAEETNI